MRDGTAIDVIAPPSLSRMPQVPSLTVRTRERLTAASLEILDTTGYHVPLAEARSLLASGGARVDGSRVRIKQHMVEDALNTMRPAQLYTRERHTSPVLTLGHNAFGAQVDTHHVLDPATRRPRPFVRADQRWMTTLVDALPNIEWVQIGGQAQDVPNALQIQVAFLETAHHTTKPLVIYPYDRQGLLDCIEAAAIIGGDVDALHEKPFMFCGCVPAAPLQGSAQSIEILLTCAEHRIPVMPYTLLALGANSPASKASTLALAYADWLGALVIHQLKNPGAPVCTCGFAVLLMDMRSTLWAYAAPEVHQLHAVSANLAHEHGLPALAMTLETDNSRLDAQAGVEMVTQCLWAVLSGVEMVRCIGRLGAGKLLAAEAAVYADEIIDHVQTSAKPLTFTGADLAQSAALIDEVGPLGEYVSHAHTFEHFRDYWYPSVFDRSHFDPTGENDGSALLDCLNSQAQTIINSHQPSPLPDDVQDELARLERHWFARLA